MSNLAAMEFTSLAAGTANLDLVAGRLNGGNLVLSPEPMPGYDPTDGGVLISAAAGTSSVGKRRLAECEPADHRSYRDAMDAEVPGIARLSVDSRAIAVAVQVAAIVVRGAQWALSASQYADCRPGNSCGNIAAP